MSKINLADAAKAVLMNEGSKETFDANIAAKRSKSHHSSGHAPHGEVGADKLPSSTVTGQQDVGKIGDSPEKLKDGLPDYTKGTPSATPPGATPPVGSEPGKSLEQGRPNVKQHQVHDGRKDVVSSEEGDQDNATSYDNIRDRVKAKLAKQTFHANPGAHFQSYGEETQVEGSTISEEEEEEEEKMKSKAKAKKHSMKEEEEKHDDEAEDKKLFKKLIKKEKMKEDVNSDVDALLSGENLSEEFKEKATTIFEAAVIARSQAMVEEVEEALVEEFQIAVDQVKEELAQKLDDYISYMAEEWVKDNQLAIEQGLRAEIVEDFVGGLKNLFIEHYIDIPEEKVDVVEELTAKVEELQAEVNEQIKSNVEIHKELNEHKKSEAIHAVCEGLTQTQVEKMKSLAESVEFTTDEEFADKLVTLRTSYFTESTVKPATSSALNEEVEIVEDKKQTVSEDPLISAIASAISKTVVK